MIVKLKIRELKLMIKLIDNAIEDDTIDSWILNDMIFIKEKFHKCLNLNSLNRK